MLLAGLRKTDKGHGQEAQKPDAGAPGEAAEAAAQGAPVAQLAEAAVQPTSAGAEPQPAAQVGAAPQQEDQVPSQADVVATASEEVDLGLGQGSGSAAGQQPAVAEAAPAPPGAPTAGELEEDGQQAEPQQGPVAMDADGAEEVQQQQQDEEGLELAADGGSDPADAGPPATAKKRVRFNMEAEATPEGAPRDATMTIHLRKGDMRQVRLPAQLSPAEHGRDCPGRCKPALACPW